jgi:septal ring factor EnvC (AmiA/AmiB activator)
MLRFLDMKKTLTGFAFLVAVLGMGISMPSCPGQQAMQDKIDALEKSNLDLRKALMTSMDASRASAADMATLKTEIGQMSQELQSEATRLAASEAALKDIQAKLAAPPPKKTPPPRKRH